MCDRSDFPPYDVDAELEPIPLSNEERVALATLRILVGRGVIHVVVPTEEDTRDREH